MSLKISSIVRQSPSPCVHFNLTANDNGVVRSVQVTVDSIREMLDQFPGGRRGALLFAWAQDRLDRGANMNQLVNIEIESVI
jgi:hypothetical protein